MVEIFEKTTDKIEEKGKEVPEQKGRGGETVTTSVSVSKFFRDLVDQYNFSPTEVFRKGVAVSLYDLGVEKYNTPMNNKRSEYVKKFLKEIEKDEELNEQFEKIEFFKKMIKDLSKINDHAQNIIVFHKEITETK